MYFRMTYILADMHIGKAFMIQCKFLWIFVHNFKSKMDLLGSQRKITRISEEKVAIWKQ